MNERLETMLADLRRIDALPLADRNRCARRTSWLAEATLPEQVEFFMALLGQAVPLEANADLLLKIALGHLVRAQRRAASTSPPALDSSDSRLAASFALYRHLGPPSQARGQLLALLAVDGREAEVRALVELLVDDPPALETDVVQALSPLFQNPELTVLAVFPRLLAALSNPLLAAAVLDLANFMKRRDLAAAHPAQSRVASLISMLGELSGRLAHLEDHPAAADASALELSQSIAHSIALAVALCDALALIGDPAAIGKLYQMLERKHRRVRTEAAAALARLGEERGKKELLALAAEPVARLRVLAYAAEMRLTAEIDAQFQTPQAKAEAELTVWLAEPTQYGLPPSRCELFDQRRQFWPGFVGLVNCYLFRFSYSVTIDEQERVFSNVGVAGPLAHAFTADLADLPPDDIYAAFAGWQAAHEDIREYEVASLSRSEQLEVTRLERKLHDAGYENIQPQQMGYFFGEKALVALVEREQTAGVAVADFLEILFFPARGRRPLGGREAYCIYKGRKLLRTFNLRSPA